VFHLLKWAGDEKVVSFLREQRLLPQFSALSDANWCIDTGKDLSVRLSPVETCPAPDSSPALDWLAVRRADKRRLPVQNHPGSRRLWPQRLSRHAAHSSICQNNAPRAQRANGLVHIHHWPRRDHLPRRVGVPEDVLRGQLLRPRLLRTLVE
jgi:hypothetical protein